MLKSEAVRDIIWVAYEELTLRGFLTESERNYFQNTVITDFLRRLEDRDLNAQEEKSHLEKEASWERN